MWYLVYRKSKLMGKSQSSVEARQIAYRYCTKAYPRIQIYTQKDEWGGRLHNVESKHILNFNISYFKANGKKYVEYLTEEEDRHNLIGKRIYPNGNFYSEKSKPIKKTRNYKKIETKFKNGEISPYELLMGLPNKKK